MNRFAALAAAIAMTGSVAPALAQDNTQSVEVRGSPVRTDLQVLCPDINNELPDELARVARERSEAALIDVQFTLDGHNVGEVQASGGPSVYRRAVRRAVRGLQCASPDAGLHTVKFRVRFIDPFAALGQRTMASTVIEPSR